MHTVNDIFDRYEKERLPSLSPRTKVDYGRHIQKLRQQFGAKPAGTLSRKEIADFMNVPRGKIQRNRMLAVLSAAFTEALRWGWVEGNPCSHIERHEQIKRDRQLTEDEFESAKKLATKNRKKGGLRLALVMDLVRHSGQPQGYVLGMRWSQVHEDRNEVLFRHHLTKKKIVVPITTELQALLMQARGLSGQGEYVITTGLTGTRYTSEGFRALWQRFQNKWERTGNERFNFHDILRLGRAAKSQAKPDVEDTIEGYPQFDEAVRIDAARMSRHYQVFYCLEQSIRKLITDTMEAALGESWWDTDKVPSQIKQEVSALQSKEVDNGMKRRSERDIDYTTFGQLSQIITQNWNLFDKVLTSPKAVNRIMSGLNLLRGPIAHCCPISDHEAERLEFAVKDWFNIRVA